MYVLVSELFMNWHSNSKGRWITKSMNTLYSYVKTLIPRGQGYCRTKWTFKGKLLENKKPKHDKSWWKPLETRDSGYILDAFGETLNGECKEERIQDRKTNGT